ncbi:hypothetical protein BC936DRAFT_138155 [Jimgerdemannia flammicorona]|uniref:Uncharacterized protein n=1 Tax=Jimgerdemannia flammicorona TaxID=994334 RepID=A0A433CVL4_9FUNG|nr:hypothetical protein BC936DRAFT_138155 [Jimgerdemannia flammicorona]
MHAVPTASYDEGQDKNPGCSCAHISHKIFATRRERDTDGKCLEALPVNDGGAGFVVLLLGNPHLLERREGGKDRPADPDGVLPLRGSDNLDLHRARSQCSDLLLHAVGDTGVHSGTD